jgi:predicted dehydrogenase
MKTLKVGIIGLGFIGVAHMDALRRIGGVEISAVSDVSLDLAKRKAAQFGIEKCYSDYDELINDPDIDVIHNCTPNHLHLEVNQKIIKAGKHVFSEKPLGLDARESAKMTALLAEYPDIVAGINFCYRMTPLVQDMKHRIKRGEIGEIFLIHGSYLQDWLLFDTDYNWRVVSEFAGPSRCVADIGSHWIDTAQTVLGSKISEVCADVVTVLPVRKKPVSEVETFSIAKDLEYEDVEVTTEDYAGILVKFDNGVTGIFHCSQVSAGRKCHLNLEVNGSKASYYWNQETSDRMWKGNRDTNNELVIRNPHFMAQEVQDYTYMPAGHPEGWNDALRNTVFAFYQFIKDGKKLHSHSPDFATFDEGHYIARITEAILKSGKERRWVKIEEIA